MRGLAELRTRSLQSASPLVPERPAAHFGTGAPRKHPGGKAFKLFSWDETPVSVSSRQAPRPGWAGRLSSLRGPEKAELGTGHLPHWLAAPFPRSLLGFTGRFLSRTRHCDPMYLYLYLLEPIHATSSNLARGPWNEIP